MSDIWKGLAEPFPIEAVSWRVGATNGEKTKGLALAYIDARDVMDRLDAVCGPENWQNQYSHANGKTVCDIGVRVGGDWIWKADGAGDTDTEAEKGALSDAFKRAAVRFGIGRYLYDIKNSWAEIEAFGRSYKIKESEYRKLRALLPVPANSTPINKQGNQAKVLGADDARILFKELQSEIVELKSDAGIEAWRAKNKGRVAQLGSWSVHIENAIAEHISFLLNAKKKMEAA